ncbi:hypothetical protein SPH9361_02367 [Sphingobium sp. CECT 9361]|nr:hypothetical protein SPH9361_02367 [Sphingobium sp. CECT 9361]
MTNSAVTFLADWLPSIVTAVSILGALAGTWISVATRSRYYSEYRRRKR